MKIALRNIILSVLIFIELCLLIYAVSPPRPSENEELANLMGVKINDYPRKDYFPDGYFETVLKPGMPISQVHKMMVGYKAVLNCENLHKEIYYFNNDSGEIRFEIFYDFNNKFKEFRVKDQNNSVLIEDGCS